MLWILILLIFITDFMVMKVVNMEADILKALKFEFAQSFYFQFRASRDILQDSMGLLSKKLLLFEFS